MIDFDSQSGDIVNLREFDDGKKLRARFEKVQIELNLTKRGLLLHDVVLLQAQNLLDLKRKYPRYFQRASLQLENTSDAVRTVSADAGQQRNL